MGIAGDIVVEHQLIADTLERVGPAAPAGVGSWTAADLAAHMRSQRMGGGLIVFLGRFLVAKGIRLNDVAGVATDRTIAFYRRKGFDFALEDLRSGVPSLLLRDSVAPVTLFEVWLHHDDIRRGNGLPRPAEPESLDVAVEFAIRYQRRALGDTQIDRSTSNADLLRWLGGRPSALPPHVPALRF